MWKYFIYYKFINEFQNKPKLCSNLLLHFWKQNGKYKFYLINKKIGALIKKNDSDINN